MLKGVCRVCECKVTFLQEMTTANKIFYIKLFCVFTLKRFSFKVMLLNWVKYNGCGGCVLNTCAVRLGGVRVYYVVLRSNTDCKSSPSSLGDFHVLC